MIYNPDHESPLTIIEANLTLACIDLIYLDGVIVYANTSIRSVIEIGILRTNSRVEPMDTNSWP